MANDNTPAVRGPADYAAALVNAGLLTSADGGSDINRAALKQGTFYLGDTPYVTDQRTNSPAFLAQVMDVPSELQRMWFPAKEDYEAGGDALAKAVGRPEIAGQYCKSYSDIPTQARQRAEDGTPCPTCPVRPRQKSEELPPEAHGKKCGWAGDLQFYVVERGADGGFNADQTLWTLTLATTGMLEWKGGQNGTPSGQPPFMTKLAMLAEQTWPELDLFASVKKAGTALRLGGVIAEVRALPMTGRSAGISYSVPQFNPIAIVEVDEPPALADTSEEAAAFGDEPEPGIDPSVPF